MVPVPPSAVGSEEVIAFRISCQLELTAMTGWPDLIASSQSALVSDGPLAMQIKVVITHNSVTNQNVILMTVKQRGLKCQILKYLINKEKLIPLHGGSCSHYCIKRFIISHT
jgi:hypothetical protein